MVQWETQLKVSGAYDAEGLEYDVEIFGHKEKNLIALEQDTGRASTKFFVPSSRYHTLGHGAGHSEHAEGRAGQVSVQTNLCLWDTGLPALDPPKQHRLV